MPRCINQVPHVQTSPHIYNPHVEEQPEITDLEAVGSPDEAVAEMVDSARQDNSDTTAVEIKSGSGGLPDSLTATISSLSNRPGGGTIILGLDESQGFLPVHLANPAVLARALADRARKAVDPPVTPDIQLVPFERATLVVARVPELPTALKPCVVRRTGKSYVRSFDGDLSLSEQEAEVFRSARGQPAFDRQPVEESSMSDLDSTLTSLFIAEVRNQPSRLATMSDEEILFHKAVVAPDRTRLTLAGLYALGTYPQRLLPSLGVTASVLPGDPANESLRSQDIAYLAGALPDMLDAAMPWIRRNTSTRVVIDGQGHGRSMPQYPDEAVRELVANALVHRDLGPHMQSVSVNLRLDNERLILTNPGGLWGITVEQLGRVGGGVSRNPTLYEICKFLRTRSGARVIEGIGSGIIAARRSLTNAGMTPPRFMDNGVRFTVLLPRHTLLDPRDLAWLAQLPEVDTLTDSQKHALARMRRGETWTNYTYRTQFSMDSVEARRELVGLVQAGLAVADGESRGRMYRIASGLGARDSDSSQPSTGSVVHTTKNGAALLHLLDTGPKTATELEQESGLERAQVAYALRRLRDAGQVMLVGRQGVRTSQYRRVHPA